MTSAAKPRLSLERADWLGVCPAADHNPMILAGDAFYHFFEAIYLDFEAFHFDYGAIWCMTEGLLPEKRANSLRDWGFLLR